MKKFEDSYLIMNKIFISGKEIKFINCTIECNIATVPGARITAVDRGEDIKKGAKIIITSRIISEKRLTDFKNSFFKNRKGIEKPKKDLEDSGNRIVFQGRVYAVSKNATENSGMINIISIGLAHHLKSIKVPSLLESDSSSLKSLVRYAFKGWPVMLTKMSNRLSSFVNMMNAKDEDLGLEMKKNMQNTFLNLVKSDPKKTGAHADIFNKIKEDLGNEPITHIPFQNSNLGGKAIISGKFNEMMRTIKDNSNPDFLSFWQVLLDIFEVEIIFMPFKTEKGSCILLKSINDEISPASNLVNFVHSKETTAISKFSNSFREATRVMINLYSGNNAGNLECFPIAAGSCYVDYNESDGGFKYKLEKYGVGLPTSKTNSSTLTDLQNKLNSLKIDLSKAETAKQNIQQFANPHYDADKYIAENKIKEIQNQIDVTESRIADEKKKNENKYDYINLKGSGIYPFMSGLEKDKGIVEITRNLSYLDTLSVENEAESYDVIAKTPSYSKVVDEGNYKNKIVVFEKEGEKEKKIQSQLESGLNSLITRTTHDAIFGERNLNFNSLFIPTCIPGLPVCVYNQDDYGISYAKLNSAVHNLTPSSSTSDFSATRAITDKEGVAVSMYHSLMKGKDSDEVIEGFYNIKREGEGVPSLTRSVPPLKNAVPGVPEELTKELKEEYDFFTVNMHPASGNDFSRYPIAGEYIDARYMKYKMQVSKESNPFTSKSLFGIMFERYSFLPKK